MIDPIDTPPPSLPASELRPLDPPEPSAQRSARLLMAPPRPLPARPPSRKARAAEALEALGLLDRFLWVRAKLKLPVLTALTYHRVAHVDERFALDPGVVDVDPETFEAQLEIIKARCTVVSLRDVRLFACGKPLPPNPVFIGFDDGYLDNYEVALPILEKVGVPATFFVPTAYPDGDRIFWWDRIAWTMRRCQKSFVSLTYPWPIEVKPTADPELATKLLCRLVKRTPGVDLERFWEALESASGVSLSASDERFIARRTLMNWSQVRDMRKRGMSVESHSHDHRVLDTLSPSEANADLARSRHILSEVLGEPVRTVAYPVGYRLGDAFRRATADAGFDLGFTNATGLCSLRRFDPLDVPRMAMDPEHRGAFFKFLLLAGQPPNPHAAARRTA